MINTCRTLILNVITTGPGSEYIEPNYIPVKLTVQLQQIWNILFADCDNDYKKNYRIRQLMAVIHSTTLQHHVTDMDNRLTYWPIYDKVYFKRTPNVPALEYLLPALDKLKYTYTLFNEQNELETCWQNNPLWTHKLSSLLLAFAYQVRKLHEVEEY